MKPELQIREQLNRSNVPNHMHDGIVLWLMDGILPGSFMTAILENNLSEACNRADEMNRYRLYDFVFFLYNYAPISSWGSHDKVYAWARAHRDRRAEQTHAAIVEGQP